MKLSNIFKILVLVISLSVITGMQAQSVDDDYLQAIERADGYFDKGDYINAKAAYQIAAKLQPDEQYPKDRLQESLGLIKVQLAKNQQYVQKVMIADELFEQDQLEEARKVYQQALEILPNDPKATGKIKEIDDIIRDQIIRDEGYSKSTAEGDQYFSAGEYEKSLQAYEQAHKFKPDEQYPVDQIKEITEALKGLQANMNEYEQAIDKAEKFVSRDAYENAVEQLELAIKLRPDEAFPKQRLSEVRDLQTQYDNYTRLVTQGDELYIDKDFEQARQKYQEALSIRPDDPYVTNLLDRIDIAQADIKDLNQSSYELAIQKADKLFSQENYENAMHEYQTALHFKPEEAYALKRIEEINNFINFRIFQEEAYSQSIAKADKLFKEERYREAKEEFEKARGLKPLEQYPEVKIQEIENILAGIKSKKKSYDELIAGADKLFFADDYEEARIQYRTALEIFPNEQYPKDQITMINEILGFRDTYLKSLTHADQLLKDENYEDALLEYRKAAQLAPEENYPRKKISEINSILESIAQAKALEEAVPIDGGNDTLVSLNGGGIFEIPDEQDPGDEITEANAILDSIARAEELQQQYDAAIANADQLFNELAYTDATIAYQAASGLKTDEQYPKDKITEIEGLMDEIARAEAIDEQYNDLTTLGNQQFTYADYTAALTSFQGASSLKPDEQYPKDKIIEIRGILDAIASTAELQRQYSEAIANADQLFNEQDYSGATIAYQAASGLKPDEQYPKDKITEIEGLLDEIARAEALDKQYNELIAQADQQFADADYTVALTSFQGAGSLKPDEQYPKDKVIEIRDILDAIAGAEEIQRQYDAAIANADQLLNELDYTNSLTAYEAASGLKPDEQYPKDKIAEIEGLLDEIARAEALDKQYNDLITLGDQQFADADFTGALTSFQGAGNLKPDEQYPKDKVIEIRDILDAIAGAEEIQRQYDAAIANADQLFNEQDYTNALTSYEAASGLKPDEQYPKDKIAEIEGLLDEIARAEALDKQYNDLIALADQQFADSDFTGALTSFQGAGSLKPGEQYPKDKIIEIGGILDAIAGAEEIQRQYDAAIANADQLFNEQDYTNAQTAYEAASGLKPDEQYPKDKIVEIEGILDEIARAEALDKQYNELIAQADQQFVDTDYTAALTSFQGAGSLKPDEQYPEDKIIEIRSIMDAIAIAAELQKQYDEAITNADQLFNKQDYTNALTAYQTANGLKPDEQYPKNKIAEIEGLLDGIARAEALDKQYNDLITLGDQQFADANFTGALASFQNASDLKPDEQYPEDKIIEIRSILDAIASAAELQRQYDEAIANADQLFNEQDYTNALTVYETASVLKPDEQYPKDKIAEIGGLLDEIAKAREIRKQYDEAIAYGDKHFNNQDYENAKYEYQVANSVKPDETYPLDKIAEIETIIKEQARLKEIQGRYNIAIEKADSFFKEEQHAEALIAYEEARLIKENEAYPVDQIVIVKRKLAQFEEDIQIAYDLAISKADNYFNGESYEMAKINYTTASGLKPDELYPLDRLKEVNELILRQRQLIQEEYDKAIADADKYYASKIYDNAIESYKMAALINKSEEYPVMMIRKILKLLSERAIVEINKTPVLIPNNTTKKFAFQPVPVQDRKGNYIFFRASNKTENDYKLIVSFGEEKTKNGGVVLKIPPGTEMNEYIIRISAQYKWFSEDNNWLTMYPEGGDLEVSLIQISHTD